jgi:uncharacterized LabA/DUF88 family protein
MPHKPHQIKPKNYAFIDSQNLNLGLKNSIIKKGKVLHQGWNLDFEKFRIYLKDKYNVSKAFLFIGFLGGNEMLYTKLQSYGYICVFKPTLEIKDKATGKIRVKGNVDAELVLHTLIEKENYNKAVIVSGDGDFHCLVEYLNNTNKLEKVLVPNKNSYSSLLKRFNHKLVYLNTSDMKTKLSMANKKSP